MGTTGLETAFAALYTELVLPGVLPLALVVERLTAGRRAARPADARRSPSASPPNLCLVDLEADWEVGEHGYESRSENCCFAGRTLQGRVLLTVAAGADRVPGAVVRRGGALTAYVLLEDGDALRRRRRRRATAT